MQIESMESRVLFSSSVPAVAADDAGPGAKVAEVDGSTRVVVSSHETVGISYNPGDYLSRGQQPPSFEEYLNQPVTGVKGNSVVRPLSANENSDETNDSASTRVQVDPARFTVVNASYAARGLFFNPGDDIERGMTPLSFDEFLNSQNATSDSLADDVLR